MSIGATLGEARWKAGLTVGRLSARTRIREAIIHAIERDDFSLCGGDFYARGHLRAIAREVGADPDAIVRAYDEHHAGVPLPIRAAAMFKVDMPIKLRERRTPNWTLAMAVALTVVVVFGVVRVMGGPETPEVESAAGVKPAVMARSSAPVSPYAARPSAGPVAAAAPAAPNNLVVVRVTATRSAWVNVRDAKGKQIFAGTIHTGKSSTWMAKGKMRVVFGNAGAVRLEVNGKDLGAPGRIGQIVHRTYGPGIPRPR
jgi:cytoskeletal protein RodZ